MVAAEPKMRLERDLRKWKPATMSFLVLSIKRRMNSEPIQGSEETLANNFLRIKKAYRKKALELHPDRNYGNVDETTRSFAEVQSAYAVLSDPQERAWYDSHRNAILRDESEFSENHYEHDTRMTTTEDILKIFAKFDGRMDFSDTPSGFYKLFRDTFENLTREEELACEWEGLDLVSYPDFGRAGDDYETVVRPFYAAWTGFATKKTFSWKEIHRYSEAPDRRTRRLMERENKRLRDEAIYEYNDSVRSLVAFLKKRDPRCKPNIQSDAERQKTLRNATLAQAARSRAANQAASYQPEEIPEWMKVKELVEDDAVDERQEVIQEQVECVVCKKIFKSEQQYEAHEKSKKHIKAVKHIRFEMENDVKTLRLHEDHRNDLSQPSEHDITIISDQGVIAEDDNLATKAPELFTDLTESKELPNGSEHSLNSGMDGPASINREAGRPTNSDSLSSSIEGDCASRRIFDDLFFTETDTTSKPHAKTSDIDDITQKVDTEKIAEYSEHKEQTKVGKAKEKRARKATQQKMTNAKSGTDVGRFVSSFGFHYSADWVYSSYV